MKQQFAPQPPRSQQRTQNIQIALHARRTWFLSIVITLVLLLLIGGIFFAVNQFVLHISLFFLLFTISGILLFLIMFLVVFLLVLLWAVLTAKQRAIGRYRKAVRRSLEQSMRSYYLPENAPNLSQEQEQHLLLLGLPGSGKTKTLENFLYQAVTHSFLHNDKRIPVLIQMKYYNGFLRQYPLDALADTQAAIPIETLLAYLLDDKHQQSPQATKEPELPGIQHLRLYLRQFIEQGRIVFLCDGMNELESDALQTVHNELVDLMQTANRVIMTCRELEYQEQLLLHDFTDQGATPKTLPALSEGDVPHIAERYLQSQADELKGKSRQAAISQISQTQNLILRINRPHRYTSPFMLIRLIEALKQLDEGQAHTISRGRLLQTSVNQNLIGNDAQAVRQFLSIIAYTARRNEQRNAIQLGSHRRPTSLTGFAENLSDWLKQEASDDNTISTLLFGYLEKVATVDDHRIPELVGVLGTLGKRKFGDQVRSRARSLLSEASSPIPLRVATIGILGLIKDARDVQLLINCLHDPDDEITGTAIYLHPTLQITLTDLRSTSSKRLEQVASLRSAASFGISSRTQTHQNAGFAHW
jgi:hypothetical protein